MSGGELQRTLHGMIQKIIEEETTYIRHYVGKVMSNSDPERKGRVQVMIVELGWNTPALAKWCWPRMGNSMSIPAMNSFVEVYFLNGDQTRAVYLPYATEVERIPPMNWSGDATEHVLFADPINNMNTVKYNANTGEIEYGTRKLRVNLTTGMIDMGEATDPFVLGNQLDMWVTSTLLTIFNSHTHPTAAPGAPSTPSTTLTAPTGYLSTLIKGS